MISAASLWRGGTLTKEIVNDEWSWLRHIDDGRIVGECIPIGPRVQVAAFSLGSLKSNEPILAVTPMKVSYHLFMKFRAEFIDDSKPWVAYEVGDQVEDDVHD